ncbi:hypothetical protein [uncultured Duncaniella sp.]|uniref:hypothetical protein n=1 Tax=uncultured Duncaniella sp. TaxID=2768039 RepID=UPI0026F3FD3E|nr:hypothetical protein [uncultured Duncaniella sp.]
MRFVSGDTSGNMVATTVGDEALIMVRGVLFSKRPRQYFAKASGKGVIEVRQGGATGNLIATVEVNSSQNKFHKVKLTGVVGNSPCDLCFILKGNDITFDAWQFK